MEQRKIADMLIAGAKELDIEMRESDIKAFSLYLEELKKWKKKVNFLKHIIRTLGLDNIEAIKGRAEDEEIIKTYKSSFDCVISRALSSIKDYINLAKPYIKENGIILAMKGPVG